MSQGSGWIDSGKGVFPARGGPQKTLVQQILNDAVEDAKGRTIGESYDFVTTKVPQGIDINSVVLPLMLLLPGHGLDCSAISGDCLPDGASRVVIGLRKEW